MVNGSFRVILAKSANYQGASPRLAPHSKMTSARIPPKSALRNWNLTTGGFSFPGVGRRPGPGSQAANTLANTENQIATSVTTRSTRSCNAKRSWPSICHAAVSERSRRRGQRKRAGRRRGGRRRVASQDVGSQKRIVAGRRPRFGLRCQRIACPADRRADPHAVRSCRSTSRSRPFRKVPSIRSWRSPKPIVPTSVRRTKPCWPRALRVSGWNVELYPQIAISAAIGNQFSPSSAVRSNNRSIRSASATSSRLPCPIVAARFVRILVASGGFDVLASAGRLQRAPQRARQRRCTVRFGEDDVRADRASKANSTCAKAIAPPKPRKPSSVRMGEARSGIRHRAGTDRAASI